MDNGDLVLADFWELFQKKIALENFYIKSELKDYNPSEIHCIQYIGANPNSNVTKLADAFRMTTGGITKLTKKLIQKKLIETYKISENRKEIYFRLTEPGQEIYITHERLHQKFYQRDRHIFEQITEQEYSCIFRFVKMYSEHLDAELHKANIDMKSGVADKF